MLYLACAQASDEPGEVRLQSSQRDDIAIRLEWGGEASAECHGRLVRAVAEEGWVAYEKAMEEVRHFLLVNRTAHIHENDGSRSIGMAAIAPAARRAKWSRGNECTS